MGIICYAKANFGEELEEKTIVVFTADHGEMMGSHGYPPAMKQQPWDEAAHASNTLLNQYLQLSRSAKSVQFCCIKKEQAS
jgi:hypothetical protein